MSKAIFFKKRDKNRFRKVYQYIRKKPVDQYCSDTPFLMIVGEVTFTNSSGPETFTYSSVLPSHIFIKVPVVTAIAVDSLSNSAANVNVFVTSITTTAVQFSSSALFSGTVNFQLISQDWYNGYNKKYRRLPKNIFMFWYS